MRRVIYPLVKNGVFIVRPDADDLFSKTDLESVEGYVIENYRGTDASLLSYVPNTTVETVTMPTLVWLRDHLGSVEFSARVFANNFAAADQLARAGVAAFITALDARANDILQLSDADYAAGCEALLSSGLIDADKRAELLQLGGHAV